MRTLHLTATLLLCLTTARAQIVVIQGTDTISSSRSVLNANFSYLDSTKARSFSGSGAPGSVTGSVLGSLYADTAGGVTYQCFASPGPCTTVAASNWVQIGGGGGAGNVTHTGTLLSGLPVIGNGGADVTVGSKTGTGTVFVTSQAPVITSASLIAPALGVATATSINGVTISGTGTVVTNNAVNTAGSAMTLDMSASAVAGGLRVPNIAGVAPILAGALAYDTTNKNVHAGANAVDNLVALLPSSVSVANGDCAQFTVSGSTITLSSAGGACGVAAGLGDPGSNGVVVRTAVNVTTARTVTGTGPITITNGTGVAGNPTVACATCGVTGSPLSQFAATTSAQLAGILSDETGSGLAVFGTSPTIVTPTIASFANATHSHLDNPGGGVLDAAAIQTGIFPAARGGTNNGFFQISGPATTTKTWTIPNASIDWTALTGILQVKGSSAPAAVAASSQLTYLRRQANQTATTYEFASLPMLVASDYDWTQTPGGSISVGANTVTLTPGPLGVIGSVTTQYVYLSGGAGTAEAVALTGGTCDGTGQASCTITFNAANTHSGAFTVASASAGLAEAYNRLPTTGGEIWLPAAMTWRQKVTIGDGSSAAPSTKNNVTLHGYGGGATDSEVAPATAGTTITWGGPAAGTMLEIDGPFTGIHLQGLSFQCNGSNRAATGLHMTHSLNSSFRDLVFNGCSSYAVKHYAYANPTSVATGANNNTWDNISVYSGGSATAGGLQIGGTTTAGPNLDVSKNVFRNLHIGAGASGAAVNLRFADNLVFEEFVVTSGSSGILVTESVAGFPSFNTCIQCNFGGATTRVDDSGWSGSGIPIGMLFAPYDTDAVDPTGVDPIGTNGWGAGFTTLGRWFGNWYSTPSIYSAIASSTAIASTASETAFSKSYQIPAGIANDTGLRIKVRASGHYSNTGSPTLQLAIKFGGSGVSGNSFAVIPAIATPSSVSNYGWSIEGEVVVRTTGASATIQNGYCGGGITGVGVAGCTYNNNFTIDLTAAQSVFVTAQWGTSSASNTVTLDTLAIELISSGRH